MYSMHCTSSINRGGACVAHVLWSGELKKIYRKKVNWCVAVGSNPQCEFWVLEQYSHTGPFYLARKH